MAQFHLAAWHKGWDAGEVGAQLALAFEGTTVPVLLDLALADQ